MSLINQMLKDLEARKGADGNSRPQPLQRRSAMLLPWSLAVVFGLATTTLAAMLWLEHDAADRSDDTAETALVEESPRPATNAAAAAEESKAADIATAAETPAAGTTPAPLPATTPEQPRAIPEEKVSEPVPESKPAGYQEQVRMDADPIVRRTGNTQTVVDAEPEDGDFSIAPTRLGPEEQAEASLQRGRVAIEQRNYARATDELAAGIAILPREDEARMLLYQALRRQGRVAEAEGVLEEGMAEGREPWRFAEVLARNNASRGQVPMAIALLEVAPPTVAQAPDYHAMWGALLQQQGDYAAALPVYRSLVAQDPRNGRWLAGLAVARQQTGDAAGALEAYRAALDAGGLPPAIEDYALAQVTALEGEED